MYYFVVESVFTVFEYVRPFNQICEISYSVQPFRTYCIPTQQKLKIEQRE
jgi:hypothetical protein